MAPSRRRGVAKASSAAAAAAARRQWKVGDLVLAKVKGFPAWPATVSEPAKWGYSTDWKKVLVYFFGTKQIAFCNPGDVEAFTEEKKKSLLTKRQGKGADFVRAVQEIIDCYENSRVHGQDDEECFGQEDTVSNAEYFEASVDKSSSNFLVQSPVLLQNSRSESLCASSDNHLEVTAALEIADLRDMGKSSEPVQNLPSVNHLNEMSLGANSFLSNRSGDTLFQSFVRQKRVRRSRSTSKADRSSHHYLSAARKIADVCDADRTPETPAENVLSVDHVKETTLATTNSLRKGSGDILLQSIVGQKRVRRSRSTSKADPSRLQSHLLPLTGSNTDNGNLIPCFVREEFTRGIKETKISPESSVWHDAMSPGYSAAFVSCGSCEDNESEIVLTNSETISFNKGSTIESSFKSAGPNTMVDYSERDVQLSERLHFQDEAVVLKKKRKPTRKRVAHDVTATTSSPNKEAGCDVPASKIISNFPDGCEKVHEQSSRADGDEHLPLVKRARVRMGKLPPEETQLIDIGGTEEKFLQKSLMNHTQKVSSSDCANSSGSALEVKEAVVVSSPQNCSNRTENEPSFWKAKKYQLHGLVDGEAALPPSKRLHRALEAMSANAIEDDQTYIEPCETAQDLSSSGCSVSSEKSLSHTSVDEKVTIVPDAEDVNSLGGNGACMDSANGYAPDLASPTTVVETMTYSEVKSSGHIVECSIIPEHENVDEVVINNTNLVDVKNVQVLSGSVSFVQAATNTRSPQSNTERKQGANESPLGSFNQASPFEKEDKDDILIHSNETTENIVKVECDYSQVDKSGQEHIATQPNSQGLDPVSEEDIGTGNSLPVAIGDSCKSTESLTPPPGKNFNDLCDVVKETKHKVEDKEIDAPSYSSSMKVLIAAAQAKRNLCRSTSLSDNVLLDKAVYDTVASPSLGRRIDSYEKISPNSSISRVLAGEKMNYLLHNGSASPGACKKTTHLELEEGNSGSSFSHKKFSGRCTNVEANAAQRSFESMLGTLTRTKESISRATRLAIDCAKYGIATEVLEILVRTLERESSLHKRVDLFFLVDSITQRSRSHKGDVGAIYPSVVQSMLPRLLSAAAPPGNTARENRKQCLKVLRLWLERKTLPESIVRHHMRQLDSITDVSFSGARSRRPSRMERALNDPIREMEGMLVDEYGSNASFHLPGFSMPRMLEDDEGSDADERNFEAVTPERDPQTPNEQESAPPPAVEKHCHILEDVDGELEMEDVAPYEGERTSAYHTAGVDTMHTLHCNVEQPTPLPFAPPLPEDHPPSPPPLPSSPPPMPPPLPSTAVPPTSSAVCHPFTEFADSNHYTTSHPGPVVKSMMLDTVQSYSLGYRDFVKQTPRSTSSSSSGSSCSFPIPQSAIQSSNTVQRVDGSTMRNQSCYVQPPPPTLSNQFSYVQSDQRRQSWMHTSSSLSKTFPFGHDLHRENRYDNRDIIEQAPYEIGDKCKIAAPVHSGAVHSDNPEAFVSVSHYAPPNDSRILNRGWSFPPRAINYRHPTPSRPPECTVAGPNGAPNFWIPR